MTELETLAQLWQTAWKRKNRVEIKRIREEAFKGRECTIHALESLTEKRLTITQLNMRVGQILTGKPIIGGDIRNFHRMIERIISQSQTDAGKVLSKKNFHWEWLTALQIKKRLRTDKEQFILADESEEHAHHLAYAMDHHWFEDTFHRPISLQGYKKYHVVVFTDRKK